MDGINILTLALCIGVPFLASKLDKSQKMPSFFSAVVICYAIGIVLGNVIPDYINTKLTEKLAGASMIIALPLLLFSAKLKENWKLAGPGLISYALCALAGLIATLATAWYFHDAQPGGWMIAGMLTGLYTGGTPNMQAIGIAVEAPSDFIVLLSSADILGGGIYLLLLMTVIHPLLGRFLPSFKMPIIEKRNDEYDDDEGEPAGMRPLFLSLGVGASAAGLTFLFTGSLDNSTLLVLLLTSFSLGLSMIPRVSNMSNAYSQGEYFLLIFCIAIGLMANFGLMLDEGLSLLAFLLISKFGLILIHWVFARIFKIDRDTVMVSSTAALYGPVFIAQITSTIRNKRLLAPGIALSLLGLAIGNYLGIAVAYAAKWLFWAG